MMQLSKPAQASSSARGLHLRAMRRMLELASRATLDQAAQRELAQLREREARARRDRACIIGLANCPICGTGVYAPPG